MTIAIVATSATLLLLLILTLSRRTLSLHRSVLLHAPQPVVWRRLEDFPQLLAEHGRGRAYGTTVRHAFVKGDSSSDGSVWRTRGTWEGRDYWFDAEIMRIEAGHQIVVRLLRDSFDTHHGLQGHIARLTLQPNGSGTSKLTWDLQARFRPMRLLWHRHWDRVGLHARLLDICLRSVKVAIDSGDDGTARVEGRPVDSGRRPHDDHEPGISPPPCSPEGSSLRTD